MRPIDSPSDPIYALCYSPRSPGWKLTVGPGFRSPSNGPRSGGWSAFLRRLKHDPDSVPSIVFVLFYFFFSGGTGRPRASAYGCVLLEFASQLRTAWDRWAYLSASSAFAVARRNGPVREREREACIPGILVGEDGARVATRTFGTNHDIAVPSTARPACRPQRRGERLSELCRHYQNLVAEPAGFQTGTRHAGKRSVVEHAARRLRGR